MSLDPYTFLQLMPAPWEFLTPFFLPFSWATYHKRHGLLWDESSVSSQETSMSTEEHYNSDVESEFMSDEETDLDSLTED